MVTIMHSQKAFTLIELMVTVAIVGILAGIALPSYQDSVRKSRRADAKAALLGLANAMERHLTEFNTYCDAAGGAGESVADCGNSDIEDTGPPGIYTISAETDDFYTITISAIAPGSYTLSAAPTGAQSGDGCGTLTLTQTGARGISGTANGCW